MVQQNLVTAEPGYSSTVLRQHRASPPLCFTTTVLHHRAAATTLTIRRRIVESPDSAALCSILRHQGRCEFFE